jgi:hypothetical protein
MGGLDWAVAMAMIQEQFEKSWAADIHTVFDAPRGTLASLPKALGGDPKVWPALTAAAASKTASFFRLLQAKANYLMLPKSVITALDAALFVYVTEAATDDGDAGETNAYYVPPNRVEIRIPGVSKQLAQAGYIFGRDLSTVPPGVSVDFPQEYYAILDTIYHEMTHAWLDLADSQGVAMVNLFAAGQEAYAEAYDVASKRLDPEKAFTEAAAYYVGDRITRWCTALSVLDNYARGTKSDHAFVENQLHEAAVAYDQDVQVYGIVDHVDIREPALSSRLRDAINAVVLDSLPLTRSFEDTPLAGLRDAILGH